MAKQNNLTPQSQQQANQHLKPVRSSIPTTLSPGVIYHIYNRGVNGETIFKEKRNYEHFINLYVKHIQPMTDTYAFCLLPNHFHLLAEIKDQDTDLTGLHGGANLTGLRDLSGLKFASQAFSNFFNAYMCPE